MTRLFQPFRAIGYISSGLPIDIQSRGQKYFLTLSIGTTFQIYDGEKLNLLFVGQEAGEITAFCSYKDYTFVSTERGELVVYKRQTIQKRIDLEVQTVVKLEIVGSLLILLGENDMNLLKVESLISGSTSAKELQLEFQISKISFNDQITALVHPSTYLNKLLIGFGSRMELYNIDSWSQIHKFENYASYISVMVQSPAIDVIALGFMDGTIILHNIRLDKEVMKFRQGSSVTCIAFRTDGEHIMATASNTGDIVLWDLIEKRLAYSMNSVHKGSIQTCFFYHGMSLLLTSGTDNSVKQWLFDSMDNSPRLLKSRSGHEKTPTDVAFYNSTSLLTSGLDSTVRFTSIIRDSQNTEFSQGSLESKAKKYNVDIEGLRLPPVTQFSFNDAKEREWDNVITCHAGDSKARTWSLKRKAIGLHTLRSSDDSVVKSVHLSTCGNFGFLGTKSGMIEKYNVQSGLIRNSFKAHSKEITSILSDNVNMTFISSSLDSSIKFWDFSNCTLIETVDIKSPVSHLRMHAESGVFAIVTDNFNILVIDMDTRKIIRNFKGHDNRITSLTFSPDGRWIISASLDHTIRTWDLPSGFLIDVFKVPEICTGISMSPTSELLATTHENHLGIFLWSNKSLYSHVPLRRLEEKDISEILLPTARGETDSEPGQDLHCMVPEMDADEEWTPLNQNLITLSCMPKSKWQNLLNLETIKERNKPIEPPKAPEKAPFFLDALPGQAPVFAATDAVEENTTKIIDWNAQQDSEFVSLVRKQDYASIISFLEVSTPSKLDVEIKCFPTDENDLDLFFRTVYQLLQTKQHFEYVQTLLHCFLKAHGDILRNMEMLSMKNVRNLVQRMDEKLEEKVLYGLCLLDFCLAN